MKLKYFGWLYFALFVFLVALNFMPVFDETGRAFGIFHMKLSGDILHVISGAWALYAVLTSRAASLLFFRVFGTAYCLDGIVGIIFGKAYLNLNLFNPNTEAVADMTTRMMINAPHVIIGGSAMFIGFVLYRWLK